VRFVVYASPDGLVAVDGGGAQLITGGFVTRDQWQAYSPSTMFAVRSENRYFAFYNSPTLGSGALVFDFSGTAATMWRFDPSRVSFWPGTVPSNTFSCTAAYNDLERDGMFMANGADLTVYRWDAGATLLSYTWQSKLFELSHPGNLGCTQAIFDPTSDTSPPATYSDVVMTVTAYPVKDASPVYTFADTLNTYELRRLESGFAARYWQYKLEGKVSVSFAGMASLAAELKYG
jgi:hypothetical protein